jgi:hypothetical protein
MNPRVVDVIPADNYTVKVWFSNGEKGIFDVKPYLDYEVFQPLKEKKMFNTVRPFIGTIQWANDADFCPDTIYLDSVKF